MKRRNSKQYINLQENENDADADADADAIAINNINHTNEEDTLSQVNRKNKYESNNTNRRNGRKEKKINSKKKIENSQISTSVKTIEIPDLLKQHNNNTSCDEVKDMVRYNNSVIYQNYKSIKDNNESIENSENNLY